MRLAHVLVVVLAPLAIITAPALADEKGTITITGTGAVSASPDTAFVTSGVTTQGATAREALDANSTAMSDLIAELTAAGIATRDIQTSGFSVQPNYVYTDGRDANGYSLPPMINGYQVLNTVTVRVNDIDKLGTILDRSVTVGANTVNGIGFSVADPSPLYDEARRKAFADARRKAELYASAAGVELDSLTMISEGRTGGFPPQPFMAREVAAAESAVPVAAGELSFQIDVTVSWSLD